jgi:hypothetical protein
MHANGFVHGDVRAGNVLYKVSEESIHVMLIDFYSAGNAGTARYSILPSRLHVRQGQSLVVWSRWNTAVGEQRRMIVSLHESPTPHSV